MLRRRRLGLADVRGQQLKPLHASSALAACPRALRLVWLVCGVVDNQLQALVIDRHCSAAYLASSREPCSETLGLRACRSIVLCGSR